MEPHPDEHLHPGDELLDWSEEHEGLKGICFKTFERNLQSVVCKLRLDTLKVLKSL